MLYDIANSELESLLLATPFAKGPELNFSGELTEDVFFNRLISHEILDNADEDIIKENKEFDGEIQDVLDSLDNRHSHVKLVHIRGYAGSGKTTYIHHLIWELKKERNIHACFLDFEGEHPAETPIYDDVFQRINRLNIQEVMEYLSTIINDLVFNNSSLISAKDIISLFIESFHQATKTESVSEVTLVKCLRQVEVVTKKNDYLYFLLLVDFLIVILECFQNSESKSTIIVIDNIDSMEPISEEARLIPVMKNFISTFYSFVRDNISRGTSYLGKSVRNVFSSSKFLFFFNTRLVTARHYGDIIFRDDERETRWKSVDFPEQYFSHKEIIENKIQFYSGLKELNRKSKQKYDKLEKVFLLAKIVYTNQIYKKLFNGNIRHCLNTLCSFQSKEAIWDKFAPCFDNTYSYRMPGDGINGMVINAVFNYFKDNGIYSNKLGLGQCSRDGKITCSRLVLTILKESDGRCSVTEVFNLLQPLFSIEEICHCVYQLSEADRIRWRRLLTFDAVFPKDDKDLLNQGIMYMSGDYDSHKMSYLVLCKAGEAYLDNVVPHFEFMLSRHNPGRGKREAIHKMPLFVGWKDKSDIIILDNIKLKLRTVFDDVQDCCYNCHCFNEKVINAGKTTKGDFLGTKYNYKSLNKENPIKQSYESRMIFSHLGYIERFRRYILSKTINTDIKLEINKLIVPYLRNYLNLYFELEDYLHNDMQDTAAILLDDLISVIEKRDYADFTTKVELRYQKGRENVYN